MVAWPNVANAVIHLLLEKKTHFVSLLLNSSHSNDQRTRQRAHQLLQPKILRFESRRRRLGRRFYLIVASVLYPKYTWKLH